MDSNQHMDGIVRAKYGAAAMAGAEGKVPNSFPRVMGPNTLKYLQEVAESGLTSGMVERFEAAFSKELGVKHCIATPGCTPALAVLAAALPFEPGDEIIVSPVTDFGTIQGLCREDYIPVFPDVAPGSPNMDARTIEPCITERTRAILAVHKTGIVCDMDPINELARKHGLFVYEDACQAVFSEYKGRLAGTLAQAAGFSFDAEKTMGSDIGGCMVTNDDSLAERMRFLGQSRGAQMVEHYGRVHAECGYAYRMPQCTAAICLAQLEIARDIVAHRDRMIRLLYSLLGQIPGIIPLAIPDYQGVYSCWMAGFSIDPKAFRCTAEEFATQVADDGVPGAGLGKYYLMPEAATFLKRRAEAKAYPYSMPPASQAYVYSGDNYPSAKAFLGSFVRWATFSEKYQEKDCKTVAEIVGAVAHRNRR